MKRALRLEILTAARALFNERGYHGVSMRDVAGALHISVGNLTYYYPTKKDLVEAVVLEGHAQYRSFPPITTVAGLDGLYRRILRHQRENPYYFLHYRQLAALSRRVYELQVQVMDDLYRALTDGFAALRRSGRMEEEVLEGQWDYLVDALVAVLIYSTARRRDKRYECFWSLTYPLLTPLGREECRRCMAQPPEGPQDPVAN